MPRVLVIDDEDTVRTAVTLILQTEGWDCEEAKNGREGLDRAHRNPPDAIVCDLNMPVMDGFQTMAEIRNDAALRTTPFVVITGQTARNNERRAFTGGADAVLLKPFNGDQLVQALKTLMDRRDAAA